MPVGQDIDFKERIHELWQLDVILERTWWIFERVIVVVSSILLLELLKEFFVRDVDTLGSLSEISKSIVLLSFSVDDLVTSYID